MKKILIIILLIIIIGIIGFFLFGMGNKSNSPKYNTEKSSYNATVKKISLDATKEIEISNFSTKIKNLKDYNRQNNITISCDKLNNTEIKPGEIFSFCNTVGKATKEKGYKEAEIIVNGKKQQGIGGGNCQISTTIYNAVLQIPELEIIERHPHSSRVYYIEEGKDAAVSYGTHDFKFKNNFDFPIKILAENTETSIDIKIVKIISAN